MAITFYMYMHALILSVKLKIKISYHKIYWVFSGHLQSLHIRKTITGGKKEFQKCPFSAPQEWNKNLIYCKTISLLPKTEYNNHVALIPVT